MFDDKEAIQHTEVHRRQGEEIHRHDGFAVISQEG
jgi:GTP cyclohydrolase FolE2